MNYKTHLSGGVLIGVATVSTAMELLPSDTIPLSVLGGVYMVSSIAGSLFPDLDHRGSYLSKRMKVTSMMVSNLFSHRGVTHSPLFLLIGSILFYWISTMFYSGILNGVVILGFSVGVLSHVLLDWLTKGGVPLFMPFSKRKFSLLNLSSGRFAEKMVFLACIFGASYLFLNNIIGMDI